MHIYSFAKISFFHNHFVKCKKSYGLEQRIIRDNRSQISHNWKRESHLWKRVRLEYNLWCCKGVRGADISYMQLQLCPLRRLRNNETLIVIRTSSTQILVYVCHSELKKKKIRIPYKID